MLVNIGGQIVDVNKQLMELDKVDCEESLYYFLSEAWRIIDASSWKDGWPIQAVAEHLEAVVDGQIRYLIINIPPRMGKSTITSVALPAWVWMQPYESHTSGPGVQFLHASYAQQLSLRDSVKCRRLITSKWYQDRWQDRFQIVSDQNTKGRFTNSRGGERLITSIGGVATGEGGNIIVIDDPNAADEATSEATIESTIEWWDGTMSSRLNDPKLGAYVIIQQRLAENDLTGHILETNIGNWTHLCLPMEYEPERSFSTLIGWKDPRTKPGELLWDDRFGQNEVDILKRTMGPYKAAGQLQQRPEPPGGGIIKRDWWLTWESKNFPPMDYILAVMDTAYTEKQENDPSAMTIWGIFSTDITARSSRILDAAGKPMFLDRTYIEGAPKAMLIYAWQERLEFHQLVEKAAKACKDFNVDKLLIENKASGISVSQEIRRLYSRENFAVQLSDPKSMDKMARLYSVQHIFSEGMVYAPDKQWAEMVITQVGQFPKGKHDDLVDTVSAGLRHLRDLGLLARTQERIEDAEASVIYPNQDTTPLYPV